MLNIKDRYGKSIYIGVGKSADLGKIEITKEAFVFLINKNNPVKSLTIEQIKDIYNAGDYINLDSETLQKFMEELNDANRKWTTNPIMTVPGKFWYNDGSSTNPSVPYSHQTTTSTCSSDYVVSSASSQIPTDINSNNTNTYVTGYNI